MTKTSADFKVANATADDLAQLNDALAYGSLSPAAESLIERVGDLGKTIAIIHYGNDRNQGDTIYWDPTWEALINSVF
ncbi:hypothetical protein [Janthinobacterium sp. PSPC3-1]|uniref:hypothetical protein n=1 Tax=Janthinobacterium sp. PSPC3-1 TaxID=2804653 RepID=UPI003CF83D6F